MLAKTKNTAIIAALTKVDIIAAQILSENGPALSVIASQCHLSHRERHWRAGQGPAGRAKFTLFENRSALLQRAAASRQENFVKLL